MRGNHLDRFVPCVMGRCLRFVRSCNVRDVIEFAKRAVKVLAVEHLPLV